MDVTHTHDSTADNIHRLRRVRVGAMSAAIDERLAPVIEECWRNGFKTSASCQDVGESLADLAEELPHMSGYVEARTARAMIEFAVDDGLRFLDAVANAGPRDDFYVRMSHWTAPGAWTHEAIALDVGTMCDERRPSCFQLLVLLVQFPASDIPEVLRRLRNHRAGRIVPPAPVDWTTVERR
jgi:hypothetical protein